MYIFYWHKFRLRKNEQRDVARTAVGNGTGRHTYFDIDVATQFTKDVFIYTHYI